MLMVSSFYKYVYIENAPEFAKRHLELCESLNIKGRILIGYEGINGSICGARSKVEEYKRLLLKNPLFSGIDFKEQTSEKPAFRKLIVRFRKEIVNSGLSVDLVNIADSITPKELKKMLDKEEDIVLVDMRNAYETLIGRFKGARTLQMKNFRDLPKFIKEIEDLKERKIVTYCTGGIRCEKASAFLKENGFRNVLQLKGGILKFGEEFKDTYWEGKCFVFDDRLSIEINKKNCQALNECVWCRKRCDDYINCHNLECDKLFICCQECRQEHNKSCSEACSMHPERRKELPVILEQFMDNL